MIFKELHLKGAFTIETEQLSDERGFFARTFCKEEFAERGISCVYVQQSISFNHEKGTLRGLHFQNEPHGESKLIRCTRGTIYDVIVDIRPESPTYLKWISVVLSEDNHMQLLLPKGFAHGFQTLCDDTEVFYQMTELYNPKSASGLRFDDPKLRIDWPLAVRHISEKDLIWPLLNETWEE